MDEKGNPVFISDGTFAKTVAVGTPANIKTYTEYNKSGVSSHYTLMDIIGQTVAGINNAKFNKGSIVRYDYKLSNAAGTDYKVIARDAEGKPILEKTMYQNVSFTQQLAGKKITVEDNIKGVDVKGGQWKGGSRTVKIGSDGNEIGRAHV